MNISRKVIGCALEVHGALGHGFLEVIYQRALACELRLCKIPHESQVAYTVMYKGIVAGTYVADLVIDRRLVVELKAVHSLCTAHEAQMINYLKASRTSAGLLINFGSKSMQVRRLVWAHDDAVPV